MQKNPSRAVYWSTDQPMKILLCNEGFLIDGVASYNLYLSAALQQAGHQVGVIGRWAGFKGFQKRHRQAGVRVLQSYSFTVSNPRIRKMARNFNPCIIITDARRSFPLAQQIHRITNAFVLTVFHDPPAFKNKKGRSKEDVIAGSHAWVTAEKSIYDDLIKINAPLPVYHIQRPITGVVCPTPLPPKDPFRVLCVGRLSKWKAPGFRWLVENAAHLKEEIPSLEIAMVGGGRRLINFRRMARKTERRAKNRFINILGTQTDPTPWFKWATVVCAGATSAVEAILSGRPTIAFSGFWIGRITFHNIASAALTHFGERHGDFYVRQKPEVIGQELIALYRHWQDQTVAEETALLVENLAPAYDAQKVCRAFESVFADF
jgi:glycosyltransferase involved in cell wall biosynthesis